MHQDATCLRLHLFGFPAPLTATPPVLGSSTTTIAQLRRRRPSGCIGQVLLWRARSNDLPRRTIAPPVRERASGRCARATCAALAGGSETRSTDAHGWAQNFVRLEGGAGWKPHTMPRWSTVENTQCAVRACGQHVRTLQICALRTTTTSCCNDVLRADC